MEVLHDNTTPAVSMIQFQQQKHKDQNKNKTGQLGGTRAGIGGSRRTFAPDIRLHLHECVPEGRTDPTG